MALPLQLTEQCSEEFYSSQRMIISLTFSLQLQRIQFPGDFLEHCLGHDAIRSVFGVIPAGCDIRKLLPQLSKQLLHSLFVT